MWTVDWAYIRSNQISHKRIAWINTLNKGQLIEVSDKFQIPVDNSFVVDYLRKLLLKHVKQL